MAKGGGSNSSNHSSNHNQNHGNASATQKSSSNSSTSTSTSTLTDGELAKAAYLSIGHTGSDQQLAKTFESFQSHLSSRPEIYFTARLDLILPAFHLLLFSSQPLSDLPQGSSQAAIVSAFILHYPYANHQPHLQPFRQVIIKAKNSIKSKSKDKDDLVSLAINLPLLVTLEALLDGHEALAWLSQRSPTDLLAGRFPSAPAPLLESTASLQSNLVRQKMERLNALAQTEAAQSSSSVEPTADSVERGRSRTQTHTVDGIESAFPSSRSPSPQPDEPLSSISEDFQVEPSSDSASRDVESTVSKGKEKASSSNPTSTNLTSTSTNTTTTNPISTNPSASNNTSTSPTSTTQIEAASPPVTSQVVSPPSETPPSSKPISAAAAAIIAARSSGAKAAVVAGGVRRARPRQKVKKPSAEALPQSQDHDHDHSDSEGGGGGSDDSDGPTNCTCCHGEKVGPGFHSPESSMKMFSALSGRVRDWFMDSLRRFPSHLDDIGVVVLESEALEASGVPASDPVWLEWGTRTARAMNESTLSSKTELTTILNGLPECPREKNSIKTDVIPSVPDGLSDAEAWNSLGSLKHFRPLMRALSSLSEMHESKISAEFKNVDFAPGKSKKSTSTNNNPEQMAKIKAARTETFLKDMKKKEITSQQTSTEGDSSVSTNETTTTKIKEVTTKRPSPPWARRISHTTSKNATRIAYLSSDEEDEDDGKENARKSARSTHLIGLLQEGTKRALSMREQAELRSLNMVSLGTLQLSITPSQVRILSERNPIVSHEVLTCLCKESTQSDVKVFQLFKTRQTQATQELIDLLKSSSVNLVDYLSPLASLPPSLRTFDLLTRLLGDKTQTVFRSKPLEIPQVDPEKRVALRAPACRATLGGLARTYCLPEFLSRQVDQIEKSKREGENVDKAIGLLCQFVGSLLTSGLLSVDQPTAGAAIDAASSEKATYGASKNANSTANAKSEKSDTSDTRTSKTFTQESTGVETENERKVFFESAHQSENDANDANEEEATAVDIMLTELKHFAIRFTQRSDCAELFKKIVEREREG